MLGLRRLRVTALTRGRPPLTPAACCSSRGDRSDLCRELAFDDYREPLVVVSQDERVGKLTGKPEACAGGVRLLRTKSESGEGVGSHREAGGASKATSPDGQLRQLCGGRLQG